MSGGIEKLIMMDTSYDMIKLCKDTEKDVHNENIETSYIVGNEEFLPLKERCACILICPFLPIKKKILICPFWIHVQYTKRGIFNLLI